MIMMEQTVNGIKRQMLFYGSWDEACLRLQDLRGVAKLAEYTPKEDTYDNAFRLIAFRVEKGDSVIEMSIRLLTSDEAIMTNPVVRVFEMWEDAS